jgi:hypothetical protein
MTFRAKNLGIFLTKQQESKILLQEATEEKKIHWQYVSLHCDTIHDDHRQRQSSGTSEIKAKQTTSTKGRRSRGSGSCSFHFPRQVGRTIDKGEYKVG